MQMLPHRHGCLVGAMNTLSLYIQPVFSHFFWKFLRNALRSPLGISSSTIISCRRGEGRGGGGGNSNAARC